MLALDDKWTVKGHHLKAKCVKSQYCRGPFGQKMSISFSSNDTRGNKRFQRKDAMPCVVEMSSVDRIPS